MLKNESRISINVCNVGNKEGHVLWNVKWRNISCVMQRYERKWNYGYLLLKWLFEEYHQSMRTTKVSQLQIIDWRTVSVKIWSWEW